MSHLEQALRNLEIATAALAKMPLEDIEEAEAVLAWRAKAIADLATETVIDAEITALDENGRPSFDLLQGFGGRAPLTELYAFDLLMFQGTDVRLCPLDERRGQLHQIVEQLPDTIRYSEAFNVPPSRPHPGGEKA